MLNRPTILETERLRLRPVEFADVPILADLWSDADVTRHMGGPRDRAKLVEIFEQTARDPLADCKFWRH